ncbi:hypothetical protein C0995_007859 [Termitomyces sp. Mi166|nr:hypothetical protein C0995_007859 [Termitomyces sp. Mi166\
MDAHKGSSVPVAPISMEVYAQRMDGQEGAGLVHEPIPGRGGVRDFSSPGPSSPLNKRFNLSSRRPLRSSPLAGPALFHSPIMQTDVDTESPVIYPTPSSPSPVTLGCERSRTSKNLVRFSESLLDQSQVRTAKSYTSSSRLPAQSSFHQTYKGNPFLSDPPMEPLLPVPALVSAPFYADEVSPLTSRTHHRPSSQPMTSTLRPPVTRSRQNSRPTSAPPTSARFLYTSASPPKSQPGFDNWMTTNTYATTPRFSRLGITAPNVVLPISAREYKRVAKRARGSPGRDLPLEGTRSLESLTITESTISSSLETLPSSSSSSIAPCDTSVSDVETMIEGEEGNTNISKVEHPEFSHLHLERCSSPSIYSCESIESHVFTGPALETVIKGCSEDGFVNGRRESSVSRPGPKMIKQDETRGGVLSKFWNKLAGARKRRR